MLTKPSPFDQDDQVSYTPSGKDLIWERLSALIRPRSGHRGRDESSAMLEVMLKGRRKGLCCLAMVFAC